MAASISYTIPSQVLDKLYQETSIIASVKVPHVSDLSDGNYDNSMENFEPHKWSHTSVVSWRPKSEILHFIRYHIL
jgi:hypothetical protein